LKQRATAKPNLAASRIRRLHASATAVGNNPTAKGSSYDSGSGPE